MRTRVLGVMAAMLAASVLSLGGVESLATPSADAATAKCTTKTAPTKAFKPTKATFYSLGRSVGVVSVKRTKTGAIGTPPLTNTGKHLVGWDPGVKPGATSGVVIMDAHTWPDNSALGNLFLSKLKTGAFIRIADGSGHFACYKVTKRQEWPRQKVPTGTIFTNTSKTQRLVIIVCSGKRVGPENWLNRTVWTAQIVGR